MTRDEIREITAIVGDDSRYKHFVRRINKEFETSDENRNSNVYTLYVENSEGERIGFCVIGVSSAKMKVWGQTFVDEGWVKPDFKMDETSYELMYIYIQPQYRDKDFGKQLFQKAVEFTKAKKVNNIYAYVSDRNPDSLKFYKKLRANIIQNFSDDGFSSAFLNWQLK
jgi:ribosomal protein S18 acetylase RimI-like enzyme